MLPVRLASIVVVQFHCAIHQGDTCEAHQVKQCRTTHCSSPTASLPTASSPTASSSQSERLNFGITNSVLPMLYALRLALYIASGNRRTISDDNSGVSRR
jgi:hypothetical protein